MSGNYDINRSLFLRQCFRGLEAAASFANLFSALNLRILPKFLFFQLLATETSSLIISFLQIRISNCIHLNHLR